MSDWGDAPILDLHHLAQQTFGDRDLADEVLTLFAQQCGTLMPVIRTGEEPRMRTAAHALKGAALAVGAARVAVLTGLVEEEPGAAAHAIDLDRAVAEVLTAIAHRRDVTR